MSGFKKTLTLFLSLLVLRLAVASLGFLYPQTVMTYDSPQYWAMAGELLQGKPLTYKGILDFTRTPLWPLLVAFCRAVWDSPGSVILLNALLWSISGLFIYKIIGGKKGLFAALILNLSPLSWKLANTLMSESLLVLSILGALLLAKRGGFWAGASSGLVAFVKPIGLFFGSLVLSTKRRASFLLGFGATVLTWAIRNWLITGALTFSTISDINLIFYIAPRVVAKAEGIELVEAEKRVAEMVEQEVGLGNVTVFYGGVDFSGDSRLLPAARRVAWRLILQHPKELLFLTAKGTLFSLAPPVFWSKAGKGWRALNEALVKGKLDLSDNILPLTAYSFLFTIAFYIFLLVRLPKTDRFGWLLVALAALLILVPGPLGSPRFRLPAEPLLLIAAFRGSKISP